MNRYCTICKKEFDFPIKSMTDLDNLVCPQCHNHIDKNSRKPVDNSGTEKTETAIGNAFAAFCSFLYLFYLCVSIAGVVGFVLKIYSLEYWCTGICLAAYFLQILFRYNTFQSGLIFLPLGAVAGYFLFENLRIPGACFGVLAVFILRHLIRDIIWALLRKLIKLGNS